MKSAKLIILTTVLFSSICLGEVKGYAEETTEYGASMKSKSTVSFEEDTSTTDPLDPINPDDKNPIKPTDPGDHEECTAGPLSIDYVSNIRFGLNKSSGKEEIYWANLDTIKDSKDTELEVPNFVQVTDKRGVWNGWHLTVTQEEQFYNASAKKSLDGAVMTLNNGVANSKDGGETPSVSAPVTLTPGESVDVASANEGKGSGTWSVRYGDNQEEGKKSISLKVPGATTKAKGEYATTLTWKLSDSPV
ncbi:WxL domain-containing protein [Enterococcus faecalis]|nr:WxL domain-containing protein [Enterococcus faecalis]EHU8849983.1 WxL domain-containing protein [Enterococcus faecalis]EIR3906456.1 WxL domain-containing protein [Enterococcus faecalis]EIZ1227084.1 WxL domain-containing protein [Enterococcus faecalis]EKJ3578981.1 WxL domain-containing protein [Enterococcus faecalis]